MNTGRFQLDRAGWRKVLIAVFIALVLYAVTIFAVEFKKYRRVSLQLENLSDKSAAQVQQQNLAAFEAALTFSRKHYRDEMLNHAAAGLFGVIALVYVERKTRK